jgi:hypothetical protein
MDEMSTMQQCVTKMKEKNMVLNPETCKFVPKPKSRPSKKNIPKPILKTGKKLQLFEEKLPTGLDLELSEPMVQINSNVRENTQNFNNTNTWSPEPILEPIPELDLKNLTKAQLKKQQAQLKKQQEQEEKEENTRLATALLPATNNPSVIGKKTLQQVYDEGRDNRYIQSDLTKKYKYTPAEVRSSINLTRFKKAKESNENYKLQEFNENTLLQRMKEKEARAKIKRDLENKARENKAKKNKANETRKLQVRKKANATRTQTSKTRKKEAQVPIESNPTLLQRVNERRKEAERQRLAKLQQVLNKPESNSNSSNDE